MPKGKQLGLELPEEFKEKEVAKLPIPVVTFEYVTSLDVARETLKRLPKLTFEAIGVDIETTALNPHDGKIRLIQIAILDWPVIILDCLHIGGVHLIADLLAKLFRGRRKVAQNAVFECKWLTHNGVEFEIPLFDTMIADQLINCGHFNKSASLAAIAERYLGFYIPKEEQRSDWSLPRLSQEQLEYAARDASILLPLRKAQLNRLAKLGLLEVSVIEMSAVPAVAQMERLGLRFDWKALKVQINEVEKKRIKAQRDFEDLLDKTLVSRGEAGLDRNLFGEPTVNINSPEQLKPLLNLSGLSLETVDQKELKLNAENPLINSYLTFKHLTTEKSDAVKYTKHRHNVTGRAYPSFNQLGADTGRFSCKQPNVQNLPRSADFRRTVIPQDGYVFVVADYSQIELRIAADLTNDTVMVQTFIDGIDIHTQTASLAYGCSLDKVTPHIRQGAKAINFGFIYGQQAPGFKNFAKTQYRVEFTLDEAFKFRQKFFDSYEGIAAWHRQLEFDIYSLTHVTTRSGRQRFLDGNNRRTTIAANTPVQGLGADILKLAMGNLYVAFKPYRGEARIVNCVHDEILVEVRQDLAEEIGPLLSGTMIKAGERYIKRVPVEADYGIGPNWKAAKK